MRLWKLGRTCEIIYVDDGSTDGSLAVLARNGRVWIRVCE